MHDLGVTPSDGKESPRRIRITRERRSACLRGPHPIRRNGRGLADAPKR